MDFDKFHVCVGLDFCEWWGYERDVNGRLHIGFLFLLIIGILDNGNELPIAWIDVNGKQFYPKIFIEGSKNLKQNDVNGDEKFSSQNCKFNLS